MVSPAVFHAISTELLIGSFAVSTLATLVCSAFSIHPGLSSRLKSKFGSTLDSAAYFAAIFGMFTIPAAIITGYTTSESMNSFGAMSVNKMLLSGLCIGFWSALISGRRMCGSRLWEHRGLAALQGGIAMVGFGCVVMLGSIGGQLGRGESALDLLPFKFVLDIAPAIGLEQAIGLLFLSMVILVVSLKVINRPVISNLSKQ